MAEIRPYKALRFSKDAGDIGELLCPPYDIISESERAEYIDKNCYNIVRLELPKGDDPYLNAKTLLNEWRDKGILSKDTDDAIYIYEEEYEVAGERRKIKGFVSLCKLEEFEKGIVLPHENTLSKAKQDRFDLMKATFCNFSQIYSLYRDPNHITSDKIARLSSCAPHIETEAFGVIHRLWVVNDPVAIKSITDDFKDRQLFIADGHHRYETALNFRNYCRENGLAKEGSDTDYVMMMLTDMENEGLTVFPTHRLINGISDFSKEKVLSFCREYFDIYEMSDISEAEKSLDALYRQGKCAFAFITEDSSWTLLTLRDRAVMDNFLPDECKAVRELDVSVLHTLILERALGIDKENMANQKNLTYTRSFTEALDCVKSKKAQCAFIINPTRVSEISNVASSGGKMPQKSTYFYPKLVTGLVMNGMDLSK